MWIRKNLNPFDLETDDCVVRAISLVTGKSWKTVYLGLAVSGCEMARMPDNNAVWGRYLRSLGWHRGAIPDICPDCYTVSDFASDNPDGIYILCGNGHVVAMIDGNWYDTSDTGSMPVLYFWEKYNALQ